MNASALVSQVVPRRHVPTFGGRVSDTLYNHLEGLQQRADRSCETHPADSGLMPNDALYLLRVGNVRELCNFIEKLSAESKKPVRDILGAINAAKAQVTDMFQFAGPALDALLRDFKDSQLKAE